MEGDALTTNLTPDAISKTLERLRLMRHRIATTATKPTEEHPSLMPLLSASAEVCALDNAIRVLEAELKAAAS